MTTTTNSPPSHRFRIFQSAPARLSLLLILGAITVLYLSLTLGFISPPSSSLDLGLPWLSSSLNMRYADGVAYVDTLGEGGRHPIEEMIERGRVKAEALEAKKQGGRTLRDAVEDYRREFRMEPPEGFDRWYELALRLKAPAVPSLYPLAQDSVLPFLSLPAQLLRKRARELVEQRGIFGLEYRPEAEAGKRIVATGVDGITQFKVLHREWVELSSEDAALLPPSQDPADPMMLAVWVDDVSHHPPSGRILSRSRELARAGQVWREDDLIALESEEESKQGWGNACEPPLSKAAGLEALAAVQRENGNEASFIDDPMVYADPCIHPEHLVQNGEMIMKEDWQLRGSYPMASLNSPIGGGEIIGPTTIGRRVVVPYMPWSNKTESRLWWRGNANSAFIYDKWDWRASQRFRLSKMASGRKEKGLVAGVLGQEEAGRVSPVLLDGQENLRREWRENDLLRETYLNVSLIDAETAWPCGGHYSPFFYCDNPGGERRPNCPPALDECRKTLADEYEFAHKVRDKTFAYKHKFRLDVDGFGWTTRWREELSKNNVVIKVTVYPEWWTPQAIPWYHYIPGRYDFADLYDIMAFFTGTPEERAGDVSPRRQEVLDERDKMAEDIAAHGREFAVNGLRWEDMRVYMFLLLLEYRRAWSDDRVAATFRME